MKNFDADWNKRLSKEIGRDIRDNGKRLGESGHEKGCYWAGYEKDGRYYISLNDDYAAFWETSYFDMADYCLKNCSIPPVIKSICHHIWTRRFYEDGDCDLQCNKCGEVR